jgi:hypothetical protein
VDQTGKPDRSPGRRKVRERLTGSQGFKAFPNHIAKKERKK